MTIDEFLQVIDDKLPPAPPADLTAFESDLGDSLPDEYRRFLVTCNGGYLGGRLWFTGPTPEGRSADVGIHHIGGFRDEYYYSLAEHRECYTGRIPSALLWVMDDPFGNAICVGLTGPHRGRMYFWDHENEPGDGWDGAVGSAGNLQLLADSFNSFVSGLRNRESDS